MSQFDPDELHLTKQYVMDLLDKIIKRWKDNGTDIKFILGLYTFKAGLSVTPEKTFAYVWGALLKFLNFLLLENAKKRGLSTGEKWAHVLGQIDQHIDEGYFDLK